MSGKNHRRVLKIDELQPTEHVLLSKVLEEIEQGQRESSGMPEIWNLGDILIIADGHHRVYNAFQKGQRKIKVNYHSLRNTGLTKKAYRYNSEKILSLAEACREAGFFHISELQVQ